MKIRGENRSPIRPGSRHDSRVIGLFSGRGVVWALFAILALGALLRGLYLAEIRPSADFAIPSADADYHNYWARALAFGDWTQPAGEPDPEIRTTPYFRAPGYSYLLAAVYRVTGRGFDAPRVAQMAMGLASVVLGFLIARVAFGPLAGLVLAGMLATYWPFYYYEGEFLDAALSLFLLLALVASLIGWRARGGPRWLLGIGLLLGFAAVVRPNFLALAPVVGLWIAWTMRSRRETGALRGLAVLALGIGLALLPTTIRNWRVAHAFVPISTNAGINLYIGNNPSAEGFVVGTTEVGNFDNCYEWPRLVESVGRRVGAPVDHVAASAWFSARAREYIAAHPGQAIALAWQKVLLFLGPVEPTDNRIVQGDRAVFPLLRLNPWSFALAFSLAIGGVIALFASRARLERRGLEIAALVGLLFVVWLASFVPFAVTARYRAPAVPLLLFFGAYFVARLIEEARARRWRALGLGLAIWIVAFGVASVNFAQAEPSLAHWHYQQGLVLNRAGRKADAEARFREALARNPKYAAVMVDLGALLAAQGKVAEALPYFEQAVGARRNDLVLLGNLAGAYELLGRTSDAHAVYQRMLTIQPGSRKAAQGAARTQ